MIEISQWGIFFWRENMNRETGLKNTDRLHLTDPVIPTFEVGDKVNGILRRDLQNGNGGVHPSTVRELKITGFTKEGEVVLVPSDGDGEQVKIGIEDFVYNGGLDDPDAEIYQLVRDFA